MSSTTSRPDLGTLAEEWHVAFGLLNNERPKGADGNHEIARRLTRRRLLLHNRPAHKRLFENTSTTALIEAAHIAGFSYMLIQAEGYVVTDPELFCEIIGRLLQRSFVAAGHAVGLKRKEFRCLLVNVGQWALAGKPPVSRANAELAGFDSAAQTVVPFGVESLKDAAVYLEPDEPEIFFRQLHDLYEQVAYWKGRVWFENTDYALEAEDLGENPRPIRTLISLPAGLMANCMLHVQSFDLNTRVIFFDANPAALAFRRWLLENWDGRNYESAVQRWIASRAHCNPVRPNQVKIESDFSRGPFGSEAAFVDHWTMYRKLHHEFIRANLFDSTSNRVLQAIDPECGNTFVWWSNVFHSLETHTLQNELETTCLFKAWLKALRNRNPNVCVCGLDDEGRFVSGSLAENPDR